MFLVKVQNLPVSSLYNTECSKRNVAVNSDTAVLLLSTSLQLYLGWPFQLHVTVRHVRA